MKKIDLKKINSLPTASESLDKKYGVKGTVSRDMFEAKAKSWYCAEILKDARKANGLTQGQLAAKIGKHREYISLLEKGKTDMQLSTFFLMSKVLGVDLTKYISL